MPIKISDSELSNWSRHYDTLLWNTTTIFAGLFGGLIAFSYQMFFAPLSVAGMLLCPIPVYFAASFRESRDLVHVQMSEELRLALFSGRKLVQWPLYVFIFIVLEALFFYLLTEHLPEYFIAWCALFLVTAIITATGIRLGRKNSKKDHFSLVSP
ncbi:MAG: hypothetical protein Q7K57_14955 [Burkholderiaceae bacterium]|nr:hypothetical protein [Burkholderiaceae bacterium]